MPPGARYLKEQKSGCGVGLVGYNVLTGTAKYTPWIAIPVSLTELVQDPVHLLCFRFEVKL